MGDQEEPRKDQEAGEAEAQGQVDSENGGTPGLFADENGPGRVPASYKEGLDYWNKDSHGFHSMENYLRRIADSMFFLGHSDYPDVITTVSPWVTIHEAADYIEEGKSTNQKEHMAVRSALNEIGRSLLEISALEVSLDLTENMSAKDASVWAAIMSIRTRLMIAAEELKEFWDGKHEA